MLKHWKINDICFSAQTRAGSCSMHFSPIPGDPSFTGTRLHLPDTSQLKWGLGLIIRMVYGLPFRGTLMITHDEDTSTTYAVCFGIVSERAFKLIARLRECHSYAFFPLLVAYLLSDIVLNDLEQFSTYTYYDFVSVREAMGTNMYQLASGRVESGLDLVDLPRRLTGLANALASNCSSLQGVHVIIGDIESYIKKTSKTDSYDSAVIDVLADRLRLMHQIVASALRRNEYVKESVQAQVQMVSTTPSIICEKY